MSDISKKVLRALLVLLVLLVVASIAYYRSFDFLPFALGAALGAGVSALKVVMLDRAVKKAVEMDAGSVGNYIRVQYVFRMALTGLALFLSAVVPFFSVWGAAAGILSLQGTLYFIKIFGNREENKTKSVDASRSGGD